MVLFRKLGLAIVLLACHSVTFSQIHENQIEPISSALRAREFDKAVELSRFALRESPNNAQLWTLQGIALASMGDSKEALAAFQQALKISPNSIAALAGAAQIDALHAYATCLVKLKRLDDAVTVFQTAVALHPDDRQERQLLASVQLTVHKPQDALATLGPLLQASDPRVDTLELASNAYEDSGDTPQAVSTLRQALLLDPRNVSLYLDFANISFAHESFQVGIDVITEGMVMQPNAGELYLARGVLYAQLAQYDKAESDFERVYELNPNQSLSSAAQGLVAVQANDLDHALRSVQSKLARNPNDPLLLYLQADVLSQKGADPGTPEFQLAMRSAKKAVALQPTLAAARAVLAKMYMQTGEYQEAVDQCRRALSSDPKDQTALYRLIQALRKTGQKAEIPDLLKRLAQLREQATKEERERYRYKLIEEDTPPRPPAQP